MDCKKCHKPMINASLYDPDGTIPLYDTVTEDGVMWACINEGCEIGKQNIV